MHDRLKRTAGSLAMVLAFFVAYRLLAVPWIEPQVAKKGRDDPPPHPVKIRDVMAPYRQFFPPGAWEVGKNPEPLVLESSTAKLAMREYQILPNDPAKPLENNRVKIVPCTVLFLPDGELMEDDTDASRRVIILQAPMAVVQFDQPVDFAGGKIGHMIGGVFDGEITIRGTPSHPGADDALFVRTRDVLMNTEMIWTHAPVQFRFGPNSGTGRDMQIHLLPSVGGQKTAGPSVGGLESLDLLHDVRMRLIPGTAGMMPLDGKRPDAKRADKPPGQPSAQPAAALPDSRSALAPRPALPVPVLDLAAAGPPNPTGAWPPVALASSPPQQRAGAPTSAGRAPQQPEPPVDIRCDGKFHFDLQNYIATFEDHVDVLRAAQDGPADTATGERLLVFFAPKTTGPDGKPLPAPAAPAGHAGQKMPNNLEPRRIEMRGNPVIVRAPSNGVYMRGEHLDYNILTGRLLLEGGEEVTLQQLLDEIHARSVDYQPGEAGQLGRLLAIGPGWLRGTPPQSAPAPGAAATPPARPAPPQAGAQSAPQAPPQLFEAHWTGELRMRPDDKEHLISILGDARAGFTGQGELSAEQIYLWLLEPPPDDKAHDKPAAATAPSQSGGATAKPQAQPDRMLAVGNVRINSPQLIGNTARLEAWFKPAPLEPPAGAVGQPGQFPPPGRQQFNAPRQDSLNPNSQNPGQPQSGQQQPGSPPTAPQQRYEVNGRRIQVQLLTRGSAMEVENLAVDGQVHLVEIQTAQPGDVPLVVSGEQLKVLHANRPDTAVTVSGTPAQAGSRGLEMYGAVIQLDKGTNRLWIDGPGRMKLPANSGATGSGGLVGGFGFSASPAQRPAVAVPAVAAPPTSPAVPTYVTWQGRMDFDGLLARFERSVIAQSDSPTESRAMHTELLDVTMRRRIDFNQPSAGGNPQQPADIGRIFCHDNVLMESRTADADGPTSFQRMQARDLSLDEVTGQIDGSGPGWLTSVRLGGADLASPTAGALPGAAPRPPAIKPGGGQPAAAPGAAAQSAAKKNQLTFVKVTFLGPITGNANLHEITFHDHVVTVYGPVLRWSDQLKEDDVDKLGPDGAVMHCEHLTVRQTDLISPTPGQGDRHPLELEAKGSTISEGQLYTARADHLTYVEAKDLVILEKGDGRDYPRLDRQERPGGPISTTVAARILYWRSANRVELNDAQFLNGVQPPDPNAPPPGTAPKTAGKNRALSGAAPPAK